MNHLTTIHRLLADRKPAEAQVMCRRIADSAPEDAEAVHLLGLILCQRGQAEEACRHLRRAINLRPDIGRFHRNLAGVLGTLGLDDLALKYSQNAVTLENKCGLGHHNFGVALERVGRLDEALVAYRRSIDLDPDYAPAHSHLGNVLKQLGRIEEALCAHRRAVTIDPTSPKVQLHLAGGLWEQGNHRELVACYRNVVKMIPDSAAVHSSLIFAMYHDPACSPPDRLREAVAWDRTHALPRKRLIRPHSNDPTPGRRLRVGFVSPDLIDHPCARNILPILRAFDREQMNIFCYSSSRQVDDMTRRLKSLAGSWRDIRRLSDDQAVEIIREDRIDVLIDLCGHMGETRLPIFAHRPAPVPVQLTFPGTTGLSTMDYRFTDVHSDPVGLAEQQHVERLVRLPTSLTYDPGEVPPIVTPPILRTGHVTFGCLNRPMKITERALAAWSQILHAVRHSKLILLSGSHDGRNTRLETMLVEQGINNDRVRLVPRMPRNRFLELFNEIDIALDCFPYNGDATSLDGLWMGVPLVTLAGDSCVSRRGVSHLSTIGLRDLIADDVDKYVKLAIELADDVSRIQAMRSTLRDRVLPSLLGDGPGYTLQFQAAVRDIWSRWCLRSSN
jgi:predicted O-linked N-acetylglucosamine transferase (SPINDLY family)